MINRTHYAYLLRSGFFCVGCRNFALGKQKRRGEVAEVLNPCEYTIYNMYKRQICKDEYRAEMAKEARRQLALMNKCRMHKRRGRGIANQPFYAQIINR